MSIFDAVIQGIIQGLTEFLPVSSSGHLSLYQHFTGNSGEAAGIYSILLHLGTLLAVAIAFWKELWDMIKEFLSMAKEKYQKNLIAIITCHRGIDSLNLELGTPAPKLRSKKRVHFKI